MNFPEVVYYVATVICSVIMLGIVILAINIPCKYIESSCKTKVVK